MNRRLEAGATVGAYTVERPLDEGGFGTVYLGRHEGGRKVALKLFKESAEVVTAQRLVAQQNEIEALVRLKHPSLIELLEYGVTPDAGLFLAMELAEGEPLDRHLGRVGRMDMLEALLVARKIAEALACCHAFGVLHLDLKPSNVVLVDPHEPRIKVLDFGLATLAATWHAEHAPIAAGTVAYMAPECLVRSADRRPSPRMDLYALGTLLYEALTGMLPFTTESIGALVQEKLAGVYKPVGELVAGTPPGVESLVADLLCRDPAHRIASAAHVVARLRDAYYETLRGARTEVSGASSPPGVASSGAAQPRSAHLEEVRFVGRTRELDELSERILRAASSGDPSATASASDARDAAPSGVGPAGAHAHVEEASHVLLEGEAGIGKSRLLSELFRGIELSGLALVAYGRCRELSAVVPYSALREALSEIPAWLRKEKGERGARARVAMARALRESDGVLAGLAPELAELAGVAPSSDDLGPGGARGVADALAHLVACLSEEVPVVLALEDLQWADEATLGVIERLATTLVGLPSLLVLSSRPAADAAYRRLPSLRVMPIEPLPMADTRALVSAATGDAGEHVVSRLLEVVPLLGAGNPLFDVQVLHQLGAEGWLRRTETGEIEVVERAGAVFSAPASLADVMSRSLASLSPDTASVLAVGALIGRQFALEDLAALGLFEPAAVERAVAEAERACLCRADDGVVVLAHEGVRDRLSARIPAEDRRDHHARIARRVAESGGDPGVLAHHLEQAGEASRAADAFLDAGARASRLQDPLGASRLFRRAIELLLALPPDAATSERLARAAHELARGAGLLGNTSDTLETLRRIGSALPEGPLATAALSSSLARVHYVRGEFVDAVGHSRKALVAVGDDPALRRYQCLPSNIVGRALAAGGKFGPALDPLRKGCELAALANEHVELCHSRGILSVALSYAGHFSEAEENVAGAGHIAERLRDPARLMGTWFYRAVLAEARGDWELGLSSTAELLSFAEEHGLSGLYLYTGTMFAGRHQFHIGQLKRARVLLSNAINLGKVLGIGMGAGWAHAFLGDVCFVQGQVEEARACYEKAAEIASVGAGDAYAAGLAKAGSLHVAAVRDRDLAAVRQIGAEALEGLRASGNRSTMVTALDRLAEALLDLGQAEESAAAAAERDSLAVTLGVKQPLFWPSAPHEAAIVSSRQYWMTTRVDSARLSDDRVHPHAPTVASDSLPVDGNPRVPRGGHSGQRIRTTLFDTLASVEGFVPRLEAKVDRATTPIRRRSA